jgi:hypothetical protein
MFLSFNVRRELRDRRVMMIALMFTLIARRNRNCGHHSSTNANFQSMIGGAFHNLFPTKLNKISVLQP